MSKAKVPPQNLDAEENVLGAMMLSPHAIMAALDVGITAEDFYRHSHAKMFQAAVDLDAQGAAVDAITVADELDRRGELTEVGGKERLHEIATLVPAVTNTAHYARIVWETSRLRGLISAGEQIARLGWDRPGPLPELLERSEALVFDLTSSSTGRDGPTPLLELLRNGYARLKKLYEAGESVTGLPSGWPAFDRLTTGLQPGNLVIVAGRPSMGKTAWALNLAANTALGFGNRALVFSLEMSEQEVTQRLVAAEGRVESNRLRTGRLDPDDWRRVTEACTTLSSAPIDVDDTGTTSVGEIRSKARRYKMQHPDLALVVVDYLQLIDVRIKQGQNHATAMGEVSRGLKLLARDLDVPVVALSQLSRDVERRGDARPKLSDLRDSGAIEQDADVVVFLYRDEVYDSNSPDAGIAEVIVAKQRNGPIDTVRLRFLGRFTRFETE